MRKFDPYLWVLSLTFLLTACQSVRITSRFPVNSQAGPTQHQAVSNINIFESPECSSPCWKGIEVDKTSFGNAKEILINEYGAENVSNFEEKDLEWKANGVDGVNNGYISVADGVVVEIYIFFEESNQFSVDHLINSLGEPNWVFVNSQPNIYCQHQILIYPTLGIYADLNIPEDEKTIQLSSGVCMVRFLQRHISENMQISDGYLVEWDGYKNYCK